jgi:hypothetical protein
MPANADGPYPTLPRPHRFDPDDCDVKADRQRAYLKPIERAHA